MRGGGSEQQTLLLLQHLDRSLFAPHLYLTERAGDRLPSVPDDVPIHAYSDVPSQTGLYYPGRAMGHQTEYLCQVLRRNAIEVIYDRTFHMTMIAGPAGHRCRIPRVSTIVSPPELAVPMVESRFIWLKRKRLARSYRRAHRVLAVSQQAADSAERFYGLPSGSTDVVRNPVDVQRIMELSGKNRPERDDRLTLVCVGRMTQEKGHDDLITAVRIAESRWPSHLPPIRLWMIGDGPLRGELESRWATQLATQLATGGGTCQIEFLGNQANPAPFIRFADALVLPSHFEGMPNVVLEAMALETPIIATRVGGAMELQRDHPTILWAKPRNPDALAEAILEFANKRPEAVERVHAAKRMIEQSHDVGTCVARIQAHLLQACGPDRD